MSERLLFVLLNQNQMRVDSYIRLRDAINGNVNINLNDLGQSVILLPSFANSPRYLHEYTQDILTYIRN